jgi:hypothetical protein
MESPRSALGELKCLSLDRHEKIPGPAGNHLARPTVAQTSERLSFNALVTNFPTVAASGQNIRRVHFVENYSWLTLKVSHTGSGRGACGYRSIGSN